MDTIQEHKGNPNKSAISSSSDCFKKGSYIELSNGALRRVEDIRTEDFIQSAFRSQVFALKEVTVVKIDRDSNLLGNVIISFTCNNTYSKMNMCMPCEQPLFVYGQGWASCNPHQTFQKYDIKCQQLQVGDICLSLIERQHSASSKNIIGIAHSQLQQSYQAYAEMASIVAAAYTQHVLDKIND